MYIGRNRQCQEEMKNFPLHSKYEAKIRKIWEEEWVAEKSVHKFIAKFPELLLAVISALKKHTYGYERKNFFSRDEIDDSTHVMWEIGCNLYHIIQLLYGKMWNDYCSMSLNEEENCGRKKSFSHFLYSMSSYQSHYDDWFQWNKWNWRKKEWEWYFFFVQHICCHCTMNVILNESLVTNYLQTAI